MAKASIHPNYQLATITCACGAVYETASTRGSFAVEICARCHPFYTGRQKLIDSAGRIERFQKRYQLRPGATTAGAAPAAKAEGKPTPAKVKAAEGELAAEAGNANKGDKPKPAKAAEGNKGGGDKAQKPAEGNKSGGSGGDKAQKPAEGSKSGGGGDKAQKPKGEGKPA